MANTKQAKKRAAQSIRRQVRNRSVVTRVRNVVKGLRRTAETEAAKVGDLLSHAVSELDVASARASCTGRPLPASSRGSRRP